MTDLAAALDALTAPRRPGPRCSVGVYLERLHARDAALHARVMALLDDEAVSAAGLAVALGADGLEVQGDTVRRHRKRSTANGCRCPR